MEIKGFETDNLEVMNSFPKGKLMIFQKYTDNRFIIESTKEIDELIETLNKIKSIISEK